MNLMAFGPFSDTLLDFDSGQEGLHMVYGPNEAGKSTALRALRQMLYGIPHNSPDNFVHPYPRLRIGATLRRDDGAILEFIRRKGRNNTLRGPDDAEVLDEARLRTFLGGVDAPLFSTMFGIDHARLVQGGQEIIQGGGDIGQILFAAGSGISDFRKVRNDLLAEAENLFKPSGKRPRINEAISSLKQKRKLIRDIQLSSQEWEQHDLALKNAREKKQVLEKELEEKDRECHRLERIRDSLPAIARRKELLEDYKTCEDAVLLPSDFAKRRRDTVKKQQIEEHALARTLQNLEEIQQGLEKLAVPESLIRNAEGIGQVYQELGSHRKAMKDRGRLEGLLSGAKSEAGDILRGLRRDLTLDQADQLRVEKAESIRIQELGSEYERLITRQESTKEEMSKLSLRMSRLKSQLAKLEAPHDTDELRKILDKMQGHGDLETAYGNLCREIKKAEGEVCFGVRKLGIELKSPEAVRDLPIPSPETIDAFEQSLGNAESAVQRYRSDKDELERRVVEIDGQIEQLQLEQEVPTEHDLNEARHTREQGWQLIRGHLLNTATNGAADHEVAFVAAFPPATTLTEAYELSVRHADELADRLRREADRVAQKVSLLSDRKTREAHLTRLSRKLKNAGAELKSVRAEWSDLWEPTGISPKSPREMRAWAQQHAMLASRIPDIRDRHTRADMLMSAIETQRDAILRRLGKLGDLQISGNETLSHLVEIGEQIVLRSDKIRTRRKHLSDDLEQRENDWEEAKARAKTIDGKLLDWRQQWDATVRRLGLGADATPAQANAVTEDIKNLFTRIREADVLRKRIEGIDRDARKFEEKVSHLAEQMAPDLLNLPADQAVTDLNTRLTEAREIKSQQQNLEKQRKKEEKGLETTQGRIANIHAELSAMCQEAGCETHEQLPAAEERSARRQEIQSELDGIDRQLRQQSAGASPDAFIRDAQSVDPDGIDRRVALLSEETEMLGLRKSELDQVIGSERAELARMDGSAHAASLAEEAQGILGSLENDAEQYVRLRLASEILSQATETYREKHQGPVLARSDELFAQMTLGSFEGLRVEVDEKGATVLVGVRPGGREIVGVENMSDGTADQLYLATRMASLEACLEQNEALPFVIDDILIQFDDERAIATLEVLGELSGKTQIIFFTHHRHLSELAKRHIREEILFTHYLETSGLVSYISDSDR